MLSNKVTKLRRRAVLIAISSVVISGVVAVVALAGTIYPASHHFQGKSEAVSIMTGTTTLVTCSLTTTGESDALLHAKSVSFASCKDPREGSATVETSGEHWWFASTSTFGVPTKVDLEMGPSALVLKMEDTSFHCTITSKGYYNKSGDPWENGLDSPLVNSESELNDSNIGATWENHNGTCSQAGTNPSVALVTSTSSPMIWTDTTEPTDTILIG
jgi:hypothetical protein